MWRSPKISSDGLTCEVGRWFGLAGAADGLSPISFPLGACVPSRLRPMAYREILFPPWEEWTKDIMALLGADDSKQSAILAPQYLRPTSCPVESIR